MADGFKEMQQNVFCPYQSAVLSILSSMRSVVNNNCRRVISDTVTPENVSNWIYLQFSHGPEKVKKFMNDIRREKDGQLEMLKNQLVRIQNSMNHYKHLVFVEDVNGAERGKKAFES